MAAMWSVRENSLDMRHSLAKLVDATIRIEEAERDKTMAVLKLFSLQKELEGGEWGAGD